MAKREDRLPLSLSRIFLRRRWPDRDHSAADVDTLLERLETTADPLERHFIYENIVRATFRRRKDDRHMRDLCEKVGLQHIEEFPAIAPVLKTEIGYGKMPHVATFQCVATLMTEWGAYRRAIEIYEMALSYGIDDKRRGGFQEKIAALHQLTRE